MTDQEAREIGRFAVATAIDQADNYGGLRRSLDSHLANMADTICDRTPAGVRQQELISIADMAFWAAVGQMIDASAIEVRQ